MEFSHVGDVLHPSPDDVEAAVRAAGTNTGEEVLEAARRKKMSFVRRQLAPEASRRVDAALSEEFIGAPGWRGTPSPREKGRGAWKGRGADGRRSVRAAECSPVPPQQSVR